MRLPISGRMYRVVFIPLRDVDGDHEPGQIRIDSRLKGRRRLNTIIHEVLHACGLVSERDTSRFAGAIARMLWKLGYRSNNSR